jgi:DNA invertase Pin-like site-specific DNA recombinase
MSRPSDLNIYIYLRKSRKDLEEERKASELGETYDTLERHRRTLFAVAKKERHNIANIYEEIVSGESVAERPRIKEMLSDMESGAADAVLVMDLDRLGRGDMYDQGYLDRAFRYSGAKILTPTEMYDPESETWELVFGIKSLVAREELKAITRRMQRGRVASAGEGKSISKVPPYGYRRNDDLFLEPDPETAWVVKKMFEMMRDGHGRIAIALELDRLGIKPPNPKSRNWAPSSITSIIKNEVYIGNIIWGQVKHVKRNGKYKKIKLPREKWTIKENAHEPLVSPELFEAANRAHSGRWRPSTVATKSLSNPLAGVLKCEVCGYMMLYQPRQNRPNDTIRCVNPECKGVQKGAAFSLVEQRVIELLTEYAIDIAVNLTHQPEKNDDDAPYKKILVANKTDEIAQLEKQKSNLHDFLERGVYTVDTFLEREQNLMNRINGLLDEIRTLNDEIKKDEVRQTGANVLLPQIQTVIAEYWDADIETRNRMLKTVLEKATYLRKKEWTKRDQFVIQLYPKI